MSQAYDEDDDTFLELDEEAQAPLAEDEVSDEERARTMGWKPLPADPSRPQPWEYRGDPAKWAPAADFIAHGEEELPILRDQNRRMSEKLARQERSLGELRNTVTEQTQAIRDARALAQRADEAGYQRARNDLLAQRRNAVTDADAERVDQVQEQLDALDTARREAPAPASTTAAAAPAAPAPAAPPGVDPAVQQFIQSNASWFNDGARPHLRQAAIAMHNAVMHDPAHKSKSVADQLEVAYGKLVVAYPEIADEMGDNSDPAPRRQPVPAPRAPAAAPALRPRSAATPAQRGADPFLQIPDRERNDARRGFAGAKNLDPQLTAAEYVEIYNNPHMDVREIRARRRQGN